MTADQNLQPQSRHSAANACRTSPHSGTAKSCEQSIDSNSNRHQNEPGGDDCLERSGDECLEPLLAGDECLDPLLAGDECCDPLLAPLLSGVECLDPGEEALEAFDPVGDLTGVGDLDPGVPLLDLLPGELLLDLLPALAGEVGSIV